MSTLTRSTKTTSPRDALQRRARRFPMLALRLIAANDYTILDDDHRIGRIRLARERSLPIWLWNVTVTIPGLPFGGAKSIDDAKQRFKAAWLASKDKVGPEALAKANVEMNHANRPERYQR